MHQRCNNEKPRFVTKAGLLYRLWRRATYRRASDRRVFGDHADRFAFFRAFDLEQHRARRGCKQRVIASGAHIVAGVEGAAALADDDVAGQHLLPAVFFHTESFGD